MKRYLILVFVLCLLVGCGGEPAPVDRDTPLAPVETDAEQPPADTPMLPTPTPSSGDTGVRETDGMVMVYVPAGEFLMGSTDEDIDTILDACSVCERDWFDDEQPQHTVYLDAFWIDRTEVTNAQYRKCVEAGACEEPGCWDDSDYNAPDQPVVCVDWDQAQDYAAWAGGRLPTEAEWEKAARGTDGRIYPWGDSPRDCSKANIIACADNPLPVGSLPEGASPYGALDMIGNVAEWVADYYDDGYYSQSPFQNPQGPESGDLRVVRGGSFTHWRWCFYCACRSLDLPDTRGDAKGIRVVMDADGVTANAVTPPVPKDTPAPPAAPTAPPVVVPDGWSVFEHSFGRFSIAYPTSWDVEAESASGVTFGTSRPAMLDVDILTASCGIGTDRDDDEILLCLSDLVADSSSQPDTFRLLSTGKWDDGVHRGFFVECVQEDAGVRMLMLQLFVFVPTGEDPTKAIGAVYQRPRIQQETLGEQERKTLQNVMRTFRLGSEGGR